MGEIWWNIVYTDLVCVAGGDSWSIMYGKRSARLLPGSGHGLHAVVFGVNLDLVHM